jgi:hypothetical protein
MIEAYFDESGDPGEPSDRTLTIAGWVATTEAWHTWVEAWGQLLDDFQIHWFHTVEFEHARGQFEGWPVERKESFRQRMCSIIRSHIDQGARAIGCVIPHDHVPREERARRGTARGLDSIAAWSERHFESTISNSFLSTIAIWITEAKRSGLFKLKQRPRIGIAGGFLCFV